MEMSGSTRGILRYSEECPNVRMHTLRLMASPSATLTRRSSPCNASSMHFVTLLERPMKARARLVTYAVDKLRGRANIGEVPYLQSPALAPRLQLTQKLLLAAAERAVRHGQSIVQEVV